MGKPKLVARTILQGEVDRYIELCKEEKRIGAERETLRDQLMVSLRGGFPCPTSGPHLLEPNAASVPQVDYKQELFEYVKKKDGELRAIKYMEKLVADAPVKTVWRLLPKENTAYVEATATGPLELEQAEKQSA